MKQPRTLRHAVSAGFTLVEMLVVVAILAVLVAILVPALSSGSDTAKAVGLEKQASAISQNIKLLADACGASSVVAANPMAQSGKTLLDVVMSGTDAVEPSYVTCYQRSGLVAMGGSFAQNSSDSTWNLFGYGMTISGGGTDPIMVTYSGVPNEVAVLIATKHDPSATAASLPSSGPVVFAPGADDGTKTVTFALGGNAVAPA